MIRVVSVLAMASIKCVVFTPVVRLALQILRLLRSARSQLGLFSWRVSIVRRVVLV